MLARLFSRFSLHARTLFSPPCLLPCSPFSRLVFRSPCSRPTLFARFFLAAFCVAWPYFFPAFPVSLCLARAFRRLIGRSPCNLPLFVRRRYLVFRRFSRLVFRFPCSRLPLFRAPFAVFLLQSREFPRLVPAAAEWGSPSAAYPCRLDAAVSLPDIDRPAPFFVSPSIACSAVCA